MQIEMLEKMCLDGTFGRLAKEFPDRLSNVHANIGALLKILTASGSSLQQQQQQHQPSSAILSNRRRDFLRSQLDSADDDDEVRNCLMPSRIRKVIGKNGIIRMDSNCDRRRRCHKTQALTPLK